MSEYKKHIIKEITAYSAGRYISQFLGFFIAVFMRRFLGPLYIGMWSIVRIVISYCTFSELGSLNAIYYKVPFYIGKKDKDEAENIQNIIFSFLILMSILMSLLVLIAAIILRGRMPKELFVGFLVFPAFFIAQKIYAYYVMLLRAHKRFVVLSKVYIFDSALNLLLILLLVSRFKLYGMYLVSILLPLLDICYIGYKVKFWIRFNMIWNKVKEYVKFGFPLFISAIFSVMLYSVDRIMIAKMIGLVPLGHYSIAIMTRTYSKELSHNFATVLSPYFIEDYGRTGDISKVGQAIAKYTEVASCIMAIMLGCIYIIFPVFVSYAIPRFEPGIDAMKIMLLCTFFIVITGHLKNLLVMKERQVTLMKITFLAVVFNAVINYVAIKTNLGIAGVAAASSITAFLLFLSIVGLAFRYIKNLRLPQFFIRVFAPFAYLIFAIFLLERLVRLDNLIYESMLRLSLFLFASLIIVYYINMRTGVVSIILQIIREKFRRKKA